MRWALVSSAYVFAGLAVYSLMAVARRQMPPDEFDVFAVLWGLGFAGAAVAAVPVEQELTRSVAVDLSMGHRSWPDVRRAGLLAGAFALMVAFACALAMRLEVFGTRAAGAASIAVLVVLILSECAIAISRGVLAGLGRTDSVALLTVTQAAIRAVATSAVVVGGGGAVEAVVGVAAANLVLIGWFAPIRRGTQVGGVDGNELSLGGVRRLAASSPPRALFAIGTPALAGALAGADEVGEVGDVLVALSLTSAPVLFAAAIQAVVLPSLATAARAGRNEDLVQFVRLSVMFNLGIGVVAAAGAASVGPRALEILFGGASSVSSTALAAMTGGAALLFLANLLTSVCIACERHRAVSAWWSLGAIAMLSACALEDTLGLRVGRAVLIGAAVVTGGLIAAIRSEGGRRRANEGPQQRTNDELGIPLRP